MSRISDYIKGLEGVKKQYGNIPLRNFKFETPDCTYEFHMNSKTEKGKKMSRKEYQKFIKELKND